MEVHGRPTLCALCSDLCSDLCSGLITQCQFTSSKVSAQYVCRDTGRRHGQDVPLGVCRTEATFALNVNFWLTSLLFLLARTGPLRESSKGTSIIPRKTSKRLPDVVICAVCFYVPSNRLGTVSYRNQVNNTGQYQFYLPYRLGISSLSKFGEKGRFDGDSLCASSCMSMAFLVQSL
jgi:hypothetical protein